MSYRLLIILFFSFLLVKCSTPERKPSNLEKLQGDWVYADYNGSELYSVPTFSFLDSLCSLVAPYRDFYPYSLSGDTISIQAKIPAIFELRESAPQTFSFSLLELKAEELKLLPLSSPTERLFSHFDELNLDTIHLRRIQRKNNLRIDKIGFYRSGCLGQCASMYLELDRRGRMLFEGLQYTDKDGPHYGNIDQQDLRAIQRTIQSIELDSLKEAYQPPRSCGSNYRVFIQTRNKTYVCSAYGNYNEPIELQFLLNRLTKLYKKTSLTPDSGVPDRFSLTDFRSQIFRYSARDRN